MLADNSVFVTWTMDCEQIRAESEATGGPDDWDLSERAMRGYVEALAAHGHRVTLFLTPRVAEQQADIVLDLAARGAEPGMHLHPQTTDFGQDAHLGQLSAEVQRELLTRGRDRIAAALGDSPTAFRPGCFSASDDTFPILADLGFTHGSVSLPGRNLPDVGAVWTAAVPFAHRASATDRCAAGDLPFVEIPSAVDLRDVDGPDSGTGDARHVRLERDGCAEWAGELISRYLGRQVEVQLPVKSLVVMTHNTRRYDDPQDQYRQTLEAVVEAIEQAVEVVGLKLQPATLAEVQQYADSLT